MSLAVPGYINSEDTQYLCILAQLSIILDIIQSVKVWYFHTEALLIEPC